VGAVPLKEALASYLAGAIGAGTLMALFLANSGGAWDNAKKMIEDGKYGGKGSPAHAATVIGDTVGDPFKDTAGPAINPLLKVMNLVSLLIAPAVVLYSFGDSKNTGLRIAIAVVAALVIVGAVTFSKRKPIAVASEDEDGGAPGGPAGAVEGQPATTPEVGSDSLGKAPSGKPDAEAAGTQGGKTSGKPDGKADGKATVKA